MQADLDVNKFLSSSPSLEKFWLHYQWRKTTLQAQNIFYISNPTETSERINITYVRSLIQNLLCFWQGKYINVCKYLYCKTWKLEKQKTQYSLFSKN